MRELTGTYTRGFSLFSREIVVPGAAALTQVIPAWPARFYPGTFNVRIDDPAFSARAFDDGTFAPLAVLPWHTLVGNTLTPLPNAPQRGDAQVWRATIASRENPRPVDCWMLRRKGSRYDKVIELIAEQGLASALDLQLAAPVLVRVYARK